MKCVTNPHRLPGDAAPPPTDDQRIASIVLEDRARIGAVEVEVGDLKRRIPHRGVERWLLAGIFLLLLLDSRAAAWLLFTARALVR